jgi:hypothetical protein
LLDHAFGRRAEAGVCGFLGVAFFCAKEGLADSVVAATFVAPALSAFVADGTATSFAAFESAGFLPFPGVAALAGAVALTGDLPPDCFNAFNFLLSLKLGLCFVRLFLPLMLSFTACLGVAAAAFAEPALVFFAAGVFAITAREHGSVGPADLFLIIGQNSDDEPSFAKLVRSIVYLVL